MESQTCFLSAMFCSCISKNYFSFIAHGIYHGAGKGNGSPAEGQARTGQGDNLLRGQYSPDQSLAEKSQTRSQEKPGQTK